MNRADDERDEWLGGELDWDEPGQRPPRAADTGWPQSEQRPPLRTTLPEIQRRRVVAAVAGAAVLVAVIVIALVVFRSGPKKTAETATTTPVSTVQTTTTPTRTTTTTATTTTPTAASDTVTLPPGGTLRRGDTHVALVKKLQRALIAAGYDSVKADGDFGATTEAAVGDFQRKHDLADDGVVGQKTADALNQAAAAGG